MKCLDLLVCVAGVFKAGVSKGELVLQALGMLLSVIGALPFGFGCFAQLIDLVLQIVEELVDFDPELRLV